MDSAIQIILAALAKAGITNTFVQTAILSSIQSESSFEPKSEYSYRNTPNTRLREIFTTRLQSLTDAQLTELKKDDVKFFDAVYGYQTQVGRNNGNTQPGDGYKYRGRGFNQITFKNNYLNYGNQIGADLVSSPDLLNQVPVAAAAAAAFFAGGFATAIRNGLMKSRYGVSSIDEIKDKDTAVKVVLQTNAGWGNNIQQGFLATILEKQKQAYDKLVNYATGNPGTTITGLLTAVGLFFLGRYLYKKYV